LSKSADGDDVPPFGLGRYDRRVMVNVTFLFTTNSAVSISTTANPAPHRYKHVAKQNTNRIVVSKLHREEESSLLDAMTLPFGR